MTHAVMLIMLSGRLDRVYSADLSSDHPLRISFGVFCAETASYFAVIKKMLLMIVRIVGL